MRCVTICGDVYRSILLWEPVLCITSPKKMTGVIEGLSVVGEREAGEAEKCRNQTKVWVQGTKVMSFRSRVDAGSKLAMRLKGYTGSKEEIGLGNPRGGLPGAFQVSAEQGLLFDQFAVRKLGVPWQVLDLFPENLCEGKSKVPPISQA